MARLVVNAVTAEWGIGDNWDTVNVGVSVSRHDDGAPVTGLTTGNFRIAAITGGTHYDPVPGSVFEAKWEPGDVTPPDAIA